MDQNKNKIGCCLLLYNLCLVALWVPAFFYGAKWGNEAIEQQYYSFSYVNQIPRDWKKEPFSSLMVTNETYCPESHPELAFSRPWYGSDIGCDCLGIKAIDRALNEASNEDRIEQGSRCVRNET